MPSPRSVCTSLNNTEGMDSTAEGLIITDRTLNGTSRQHAENTLTHLLGGKKRKKKDQTTQLHGDDVSPDPSNFAYDACST